jgi:putative endonuclease
MTSPRQTARKKARKARGAAARLSGRRGEIVAALWLLAKGYRILGFRLRTPHGEIDLVARRGGVVAAVEVKARASLEPALEAVSLAQRRRLRRALAALAGRRAGLAGLRQRLDLMALAPGRWPRHIPGAWSEDGELG